MKDVYICYSKESKSTAIRLTTKLESSGISCWTAPRDIENPENEHKTKAEAIAAAKVFLLILSKSSVNSKEIADEIEIAIENGIAIVPFKIDSVPDSVSMRYFLNTLDWIDAFDTNFDEAFEVLTEVIQEKTDGNLTPPVSKPKNSKSGSSSKNKYYIVAFAVVLVIIGIWYIFSETGKDKKNTSVKTEQIGTISENENDLVGSWKIVSYEDSQKISAKDKETMDKNIAALMQRALVIFNADKSFQRIGFSPQPQNGTWELDAKGKKINLVPLGSEKKEPLNLLSFNKDRMVVVVVESVSDNNGGTEVVTTKITFQKQL
jgi:hypothetical protein